MMMLATSAAVMLPSRAAFAAASAMAWYGWPPGTSLIAMSVQMSQLSPSPRVAMAAARVPSTPPTASKKPCRVSSTLSSHRKPRCAARAAFMPSIAARPAWYSRATDVSAAVAKPPIEVADSAIACAICTASSCSIRAGGDRGGEHRAKTAVEAACRKPGVIASLIRPAAS